MARQDDARQALAPCRQAAAASAPPASADWDHRDGVNAPLPTVLATQAERTNSRVQAGQSAAVAQAAGRPTRTLPKRWDASSQAALLRRSAATVASGDCGAAEPMQERSPDQRRHNRSLRKKIAGRAVHRRRAVKGASVAEPASNRSICEPLAKPKEPARSKTTLRNRVQQAAISSTRPGLGGQQRQPSGPTAQGRNPAGSIRRT